MQDVTEQPLQPRPIASRHAAPCVQVEATRSRARSRRPWLAAGGEESYRPTHVQVDVEAASHDELEDALGGLRVGGEVLVGKPNEADTPLAHEVLELGDELLR